MILFCAPPSLLYAQIGEAYDAAFDTENYVTKDEIKDLIKAPQPRITIPGVQFSSSEEVAEDIYVEDGKTWLSIPFLGEYIAAVYRYAVVVAGILAVLVIIAGGFAIATSAGGDGVQTGKTRIAQGVIGLILTVGSYFILNLVNPELVTFRNLRVLYVPEKPLPDGEPETTTATAQRLTILSGTFNPATCNLAKFSEYAEKGELFGKKNGLCLGWVKQALNNACGGVPADLNTPLGAWDVAAQFQASGKFHPCNLDGIKDGDLVFMTSIGSNYIGLWENFRMGPNGCTIADEAKKPMRQQGSDLTPYSSGITGTPRAMPPVTHIGVYHAGKVYHLLERVEADVSTMLPITNATRNDKKIWREGNKGGDILLTGNAIHKGAEFIAGYGKW